MFEATSSLDFAVQSTVSALARDALSLDAGNLNELLSQNLHVMARQLDLLNQLIGSRAVGTVAQTLSATAAISIPSPPPPAHPESASKGNHPGPKPFGPYRPPAKDGKRQHTPEQQRSLDEFTRRYCDRTAKSKQLTAEHRPHLADPRSVAGFRQSWKEIVYPIVTDRSLGSRLWDVDGNEYIDLVNGFGSVFFGHNPEFIRNALKEQLERGVEIGPQSPMAGEVAQLICDMVGMQRAAFCNTGSEAVTAAIRVARTVTGRDRIVMFAGAYHGIFDEVLVRASPQNLGSNANRARHPCQHGRKYHGPRLWYGRCSGDDKQASKRACRRSGRARAEPTAGLQPREFLAELRKITAKSGTALVFDEVVTGFRIHPGGAQACLASKQTSRPTVRSLGVGCRSAIVAGRSQFLDALDGGMWSFGDASMPEVGVTFFAGTFVRHPLALAAARAVLLRLRESGPELQRKLNLRTTEFVERLNGLAQEAGAPVRVKHFASWFMFELPHEPQFATLFFAFMRDKGVHIWEGRPGFLTLAHTDADLDRIAAAFVETLAEMQAATFLPDSQTTLRLWTGHAWDAMLPAGPPGSFPIPIGPVKYLQVRVNGPVMSDVRIATRAYPGRFRSIRRPSRRVAAAHARAKPRCGRPSSSGPEASCSYNQCFVLTLRGPVSAESMQRALQTVVDRHESLRTTFDADGHTQRVADRVSVSLQFLDLSTQTPERRAAEINRIVTAETQLPFDLEAGPLFRAQLVLETADCQSPHLHGEPHCLRRMVLERSVRGSSASLRGGPSRPRCRASCGQLLLPVRDRRGCCS